MPGRARSRVGLALPAAALLVLLTPGVALASTPTPSPTASASASARPTSSPTRSTTPTPKPKSTASSAPKPTATPDPVTQAERAEAARLATQIVALQRTAEAEGKTAEKATEKADAAKAVAEAADEAQSEAHSAAAQAAMNAAVSRSRAATVAAQLARTDLGTLPLSLMLNGASASRVLGGLSTVGQLSQQAHLLLQQAQRDRAEADRLAAAADQKSAEAERAAAAAAKTSAAAKRKADAAKQAVQGALDRQRTLLVQLLGADPDQSDICGDLADEPVSVCLPGLPATTDHHSVGARVVAYAAAEIGKPYVFGAAGPDSYDCSGLTLAAYASAGVSIGIHSATAQYRLAKQQGDLVPVAKAKPGDLLFYTDGGGDMYHVTVYVGDGLMIEAPYPGATVREAPVRAGDLLAEAAHFG